MNVVDSSGWLEYLAGGPNASFFAGPIADGDELIVPTISVYEVHKRILQQNGEKIARRVAASMMRGTVVDLTAEIAVRAAALSHSSKLPMADSIILATAQLNSATLWTQDVDFQNMPGVQFVAKQKV